MTPSMLVSQIEHLLFPKPGETTAAIGAYTKAIAAVEEHVASELAAATKREGELVVEARDHWLRAEAAEKREAELHAALESWASQLETDTLHSDGGTGLGRVIAAEVRRRFAKGQDR